MASGGFGAVTPPLTTTFHWLAQGIVRVSKAAQADQATSYTQRMLTRAQVADRLGRSVATVRRLEGVVLHPSRGRRGVRLFEADEVDRVARDGYPPQLSDPLDSPVSAAGNFTDGRSRKAERCPSAAAFRALQQELAQTRELGKFLAQAFVELANDRMVAALEPDFAEMIEELLEE